jgi:hypothetical protein
MVAYEQRLNADTRWALSEGSRHFEDRSAVHDTLQRLAARLSTLGIPYAISDGMALFQHGYRRFTEDVDVLVTRDGLKRIHDSLDGLGYVPTVQGGRNLRDAQTGVRIDFLISGDFPGDGKPKPVQFPDPSSSDQTLEAHGVRYLKLAALVDLKLASGMTNPGRMRDLSDVQDLIRLLGLDTTFVEQLNPYVRAKFLELAASAGASETS